MIPNEAIEAAANAISECSGMRFDGFWSRIEDLDEAAGPHLRTVARQEAALDLMEVQEHESRMPGIRFAVGFLGGVTK